MNRNIVTEADLKDPENSPIFTKKKEKKDVNTNCDIFAVVICTVMTCGLVGIFVSMCFFFMGQSSIESAAVVTGVAVHEVDVNKQVEFRFKTQQEIVSEYFRINTDDLAKMEDQLAEFGLLVPIHGHDIRRYDDRVLTDFALNSEYE